MMSAAPLMIFWCLLANPAEALSTLLMNKQSAPTNASLLQAGNGDTARRAWADGTMWLEKANRASDGTGGVLGSIAPLNEAGYLSVVKLSTNAEMDVFIRRVVNKLNLELRDEGAMDGLVPHFSGVRGFSTYFLLVQELVGIASQDNTWLIEHSSPPHFRSIFMQFNVSQLSESEIDLMIDEAPLNQDGYEAVARLNGDAKMSRYMRRVIKEMGPFYVSDEGRFQGIIRFYSGRKGGAVQSFAKLRFEAIGGVRDAEPWLASGESVLVNENGYRAVAALKNDTEMATFFSTRGASLWMRRCQRRRDDGRGPILQWPSQRPELGAFAAGGARRLRTYGDSDSRALWQHP